MLLPAEAIHALCDDWVAEMLRTPKPWTGENMDSASRKYGLFQTGFLTDARCSHHFKDLDYDTFVAALIGLTKTTLLPGGRLHHGVDHACLWAWSAELLVGECSPIFNNDGNPNLRRLFALTVHSALASAAKRVYSDEEEEAVRLAKEHLPFHQNRFLENYAYAASMLCFPLLESILRHKCQSFLDHNGNVLKQFSISKARNQPKDYKVGKGRVNSIADLLYLHHQHIADSKTVEDMNGWVDCLKNMNVGASEPYEAIYEWRCNTLHGSQCTDSYIGIILNLSILLMLPELRTRFSDHQKNAFVKNRELVNPYYEKKELTGIRPKLPDFIFQVAD
jgi:hypothetical protein